MSALNYLPETYKVQIKPFEIPPQISDRTKMAYMVIGFVSQDLAFTLMDFLDDEIIQGKRRPVEKFTELTCKDMDELTALANERGHKKEFLDGLSVFILYFKELAEKSLSAYQKQNAPILIDLLTAIYEIRAIKICRPHICYSYKQQLNDKPMQFINEYEQKLTKKFNEIFKNYSNLIFDFSKFDGELKNTLNQESQLMKNLWAKTINQ